MWPLIRTELTRLRWRRAVLVLLAAMFVVPGIILASHAINTRPVTAADITRAEQEMADSKNETLQDCVRHPRQWDVDRNLSGDELLAACDEMVGDYGTVEDWLYRPQLTVSGFVDDTGLGILTVLAVLAALVGTTYVGHDWASRSMSNQLLFEPRRVRVWSAKAVALVLTVALTGAVVLALVWVAVWGLVESREIATSTSAWKDAAWTQVRGLGLVTGASVASYAITMWFRSTVGALGLMIGVGILSSILILTILGEGASHWLISSNVLAVLQNGYEYWDPAKSGFCSNVGPCDDTSTVTARAGATYLSVLMLAVTIPSLLSFRRRDVP